MVHRHCGKNFHLKIRNVFCRYCGELVQRTPARYYCDDRCAIAGSYEAAQWGYGSVDYQRAMHHYRKARASQGMSEEIIDPEEKSPK